MAGGELVPHVLPNGQTIMVPGYLAPKAPALAMPNVQAPAPGPDRRVAGGPMQGWGDDIPVLPEPTPQERAAEMRAKLMTQQSPVPSPIAPPSNEHKSAPKQPDWMPSGKGKPSEPDRVDPSTLARPGTRAEQPQGDAGGEMNPLLRRVFNEGGGGGGGPRRPGALEVGSIKEQREPGREMLPEQMWRMGLADRPQELYEVDPTAEQPTWGNADPVIREKQTGLERGATAASETARKEYELQVDQAHKQSVAERQILAQQSELMDQQLATISQRRERIAQLQDTAERRAQEAASMEPRTREQVWGSKGEVARGMAVISAFLGGMVGNTDGWKMIDKSINEAVDDDRSKWERRQKLGMSAKGELDHAMAVYGDLELATLDTKNRKLMSAMAMTKSMAADPGLDPMAKERAQAVGAQMYDKYLENARVLAEGIQGRTLSQEVTLKPGAPTGGGGGGLDTLARLERTARAEKALGVIEGRNQGSPGRSIEGDKLNDVNAALESLDAADAVERDVRGLGAESSDIDDPLSGPLDAVARVVGTGGDGRRVRQSLDANTKRLARGIQQSLGKSDNDAKLADEMAVGDGSGVARIRAAQTAKKQALGRIQTATAGMTPQQRDAFLEGLPPERRELVRGAMREVATPKRAASEERGR